MEHIKIRTATLDDLPMLQHFEQGVIKAERPLCAQIREEKVYYYDIEKLMTSANTELLVAELAGQIIGSGYARIEEAKPYLKHKYHSYLGFMYVDPNYRGRGVIKLIMDGLFKWSKEQNITEVILEVYTNNSAAIRAYEKAGFSKYLVEMRMEI